MRFAPKLRLRVRNAQTAPPSGQRLRQASRQTFVTFRISERLFERSTPVYGGAGILQGVTAPPLLAATKSRVRQRAAVRVSQGVATWCREELKQRAVSRGVDVCAVEACSA